MGDRLVSVIIPTYNREKLLPRAIDSVINQTYPNWELLIVDDRSSDNTEALVKKYISMDSRIKYLKNRRKKGPSGARNYGIINSKGEYIAFLDSDDEWAPHHLEESIYVLENYNMSLSFALWITIFEDGRCIKVFDPEIPSERARLKNMIDSYKAKVIGKYIFFGDDFYEKSFLEGGSYCTQLNTMVINRNLFKKIGYFREDMMVCEDTDLVYRAIHYYPFVLIDDYHHYYYQGIDNLFNFFDRGKLDIERAIEDKGFVERFTFVGLGVIKMNAYHKKLVKNSNKVTRKRECIGKLNNIIGRKYFTLGFINQKVNRFKAIFFTLKSILYKFTLSRFLFLTNLILPFLPIRLDREKIKGDLSLW
jgi:glycosyltransferase involved in cell wall biosynthesis